MHFFRDSGVTGFCSCKTGIQYVLYILFKLDGLESSCEDYGQAVIYRGTIPGHTHAVSLDKHHVMETGRTFPVCGNTWRRLHDTRFAEHFEFIGDFGHHYGIFKGCGESLPFGEERSGNSPVSCC